jgi:hypothetical protein
MALPWRPTIFLFEEDEVCWSGGMNVPLISRDIKPCVQKVEPRITHESRAGVTYRAPRSLSDALTGRTVDKNSGQLGLGLTDWDWRWTGMEVVTPYSSGFRAFAFEHVLPADQHGSQQKPGVCSVLGVRTVGTELAVLPGCRSKGLCGITSR